MKHYFYILLIFLLPACKKADVFCSTTRPLDDIVWLANTKYQSSDFGMKIGKITYENQDGFLVSIVLQKIASVYMGNCMIAHVISFAVTVVIYLQVAIIFIVI